MRVGRSSGVVDALAGVSETNVNKTTIKVEATAESRFLIGLLGEMNVLSCEVGAIRGFDPLAAAVTLSTGSVSGDLPYIHLSTLKPE